MNDKKGSTKLNPRKTDAVSVLSDKFGKAKAMFLTDYRGLTHQQLETLKKGLKKVEGEFVVAKNTLLKIAMQKNAKMENASMQKLEKELKNPTATLFAYGDEIAAIKELANFIKTTQLPKIKLGFFDGKLANEADFKKLASLPSREVLLSMLVGQLKSPISGLHYAMSWNLRKLVTVLGNIKDKKSASN
ncbi:50S ribosomal protein L10 [Candidatus Gottesmanbacteria bacterium]|nr:50S ribosomal protein L10 [Candidatus Gottesmanbacteria bacterium]